MESDRANWLLPGDDARYGPRGTGSPAAGQGHTAGGLQLNGSSREFRAPALVSLQANGSRRDTQPLRDGGRGQKGFAIGQPFRHRYDFSVNETLERAEQEALEGGKP